MYCIPSELCDSFALSRAILAFVATHGQLHVLFVGEAAPQECLGCRVNPRDLLFRIYRVLSRNLNLASHVISIRMFQHSG
jgi:hypothetical protein